MKRIAIEMAAAAIILGASPAPLSAEIYQPEGLHLPGSWNGWTNYPAQAFLNATRRSFGPTGYQWTTRINVQSSGGDISGATWEMLFTTGPSGSPWANLWGNATLAVNGKTALTYGTTGITNNTVTVANGNYYTFVWKDNGYQNTDVAVLRTSAVPISVGSVSNGSPTVSITLSGAKCAEERVLVRYTRDNWATSNVVEATGSGTAYSATIPGTGTASYYVATTTITSDATFLTDPDLFTLAYSNNGGTNYATPVGVSRFALD